MNSTLRNDFYKNYPEFHHTFDDGEYCLEYALYGNLGLSRFLHREIIQASEKMNEILNKVKEKIKTLSSRELIELGYNEKMIPFIDIDPLTNGSVTKRFDIVRSISGFKFIELNNDTPFLIMENYQMDNILCQELGGNPIMENRIDLLNDNMLLSLKEAAAYLGKPLDKCVIAIMGYSYEEDLEEYTTLSFYRNILLKNGIDCHYVNYKDIRVDMDVRDVLTAETGTIDILLKFAYPYEFLIEDTYSDKEGSIGLDIMQLMREKKVFLMNPPGSHILQNKSTFAYLWELVEDSSFFTREEERFIKKYVPYTTTKGPEYFERKGLDYVIKPVISREGMSVTIVKRYETINSQFNFYDDELMLYQEYLELPKRNVIIKDERVEKHEVLGVFLTGDKYSGTVCRLGSEITDWESHWTSLSLT